MSRWVLGASSWTPTATADATTFTANQFMCVGAGNSATQAISVTEIYLGGQATASAVSITQFAREKIVAATPSALVAPNSHGSTNPSAAAPSTSTIACTNATTPPQRADILTQPRLHLNYNAFGGVVRWVAEPGQGWLIIGNSANVSESCLSGFTGSSASATCGAHIAYELQ